MEHEDLTKEIKQELDDMRLVDPKRSQKAKLGWKKNRTHYRQGINKRGRKMDRDIYNSRNVKDIIADLEEALNEAEIERNNPFELENDLRFENLPGGIKTTVDRENNSVSLTLFLDEDGGQGNYKLINEIEDKELGYDNLQQNIRDDLKVAMDSFDQSIQQIIQKYGLNSTL